MPSLANLTGSQNVEDRRGEPPTPWLDTAFSNVMGFGMPSWETFKRAWREGPSKEVLSTRPATTDDPAAAALGYNSIPDTGPVATYPNAAAANLLGDPRAQNPTLADLQLGLRRAPGPNGPMPSQEEIQAYLAKSGQVYPPLYPVNQQAWDAAVEGWRPSLNIEDRRGINRRR